MSDEQKPGDPADAEIDRLNAQVVAQADLLDLAAGWADWAKGEMERLRAILAALREPSDAMQDKVCGAYFSSWDSRGIWTVVIRAAVAAAEQEVGRE